MFNNDNEETAAAAAKSLQTCPTLCDPRDSSPPGSPFSGILQPRTLEWVAISFSKQKKLLLHNNIALKFLLSTSLKMYLCTFEYVYKVNNDKNKCKGTILHP